MANTSKRAFSYAFDAIRVRCLSPRTSQFYLRPHSSALLPRATSHHFFSQTAASPGRSGFRRIGGIADAGVRGQCSLVGAEVGVSLRSKHLAPLGSGIRGLGIKNENGVNYPWFQVMRQNSVKLSKTCRSFSVNVMKPGKFGGASLLQKSLSSIRSTAWKYRQAAGLQIEGLWKRNYMIIVGAAAVVLCVMLWRLLFGVANLFVGLSEGMAKYGFLAFSAAIVALSGIYLRSRFTINPDKVYRMTVRKLNTSAEVLEVLGAPLTGTDVRAYVMSGGGPKLKNLKLRLGGKRCFLIFPIRGSERRGLVSVEAKKKKGQYDIKLLAVDIPMATGPDQRLFLVGDEQEYRVGGGLISELRDPIVKAMAAEKEFDDLDQKEEEEDERREQEEAERRQHKEKERALQEEKDRLEMERLQAEEEKKRQATEGPEKLSS